MIHDAKVPVTCDKCGAEIEIEPDYAYTSYSGAGGHYVTDDDDIELKLEKYHDWTCVNGKHYCEDCSALFDP